MGQFDSKVAIVTGGSQGLGAAIAALFVERGAHGVVICGRAKGEDRVQREFHGAADDWLQQAAAAQPFGRLIDPKEAARAVAFLASDESGLMTGAIVNLDQSIRGAYDDSPHPAEPMKNR